MSSRVTNNMMSDRLLADLRVGYERLADTQRSISSGKRVEKPSDDPLAAAQVRLRRAELEGLERHRAGADAATTWMSAADTALGRLNDILSRARELTVQAANGTVSDVDRRRIADEIDQLAEASKDALNVRMGDTYIFSGTATTTSPYAVGTGDAYQGNTAAVVRDVGPGVAVQLNPSVPTVPSGTAALTGQALLGGGQAAGDGRVLDALRDLSAHLRGGTAADLDAVRTTDLQALDRNMRAVIDARATVGATQNRVDAAVTRLDDLQGAATTALSDLEGVDLAKALTDLTVQQTAYQTALRAGAQIIQPTLMDFLR